MDERARAVYKAIAIAFLAVGGGVLLVGGLERVLGFSFFRGDPSWTGLFIAAIGGLLWWTVRDAAAGDGGGEPDEDHRE